ncbi:MAG: hypothetical protein PHR83_03525 [Paludibacter sp.]|nr:hypothetical protein [Paludibacter sp.]
MKKLSLFLLLTFSYTLFATTYYVSPAGTSTAAGTIAAPLNFTTAIAKSLVAGDSVLLRDGMYSFSSLQQISKSGTSAKFIFIGAYKNEIPILDFRTEPYNSSNQGVKLAGNYVHFKGIIVQGAGDNGLQVTGSNNKIELCTTRWNCDAGMQMKTGSDNLILNCDSYENFDYETGGTASPDYGGNADGFADKQYTNTGTNTYKGCRSWRNGDDGWDSYEKIGNTVYDSCWCFSMTPATFDMKQHIRFKTDSASWFYQFKSTNFVMTNYGNGNGFKLGGNYTANNATLHNCVSVGNPVKGFDQNNNNGIMTIYNCTSYNNGYNYGFSNSSYGTLIIKNCASLTSAKANTLACKTVTQAYNTWNTGFSCATTDFVSLDYSVMLNPRQADGSLPEVTLLHLKATSSMIDKGTNVGYAFSGVAPDLGAYEYKATNTAVAPVSENNIQAQVCFSTTSKQIVVNGSVAAVEVFELSGKKVFSSRVHADKLIIPAADLSKGVCIVRVIAPDGVCTTAKVIVE